jgi:hypothetical protein
MKLLEKSIGRYQSRAIETAQVIEELIALARDMRQAEQRGEELGLTDDEVAFYDALEVNAGAPGLFWAMKRCGSLRKSWSGQSAGERAWYGWPSRSRRRVGSADELRASEEPTLHRQAAGWSGRGGKKQPCPCRCAKVAKR